MGMPFALAYMPKTTFLHTQNPVFVRLSKKTLDKTPRHGLIYRHKPLGFFKIEYDLRRVSLFAKDF